MMYFVLKSHKIDLSTTQANIEMKISEDDLV